MARSQETFGKKEREKKKLQKRKEKLARKEERKANGSNVSEFSYVDFHGNLTDTPPDPSLKIEVEAEDIVIGIPKRVEEEVSPFRNGKVDFFNDSKGFGFIKEDGTQEKFFVHISELTEDVYENDKVVFEVERGAKGMNAVRVKKA